MSDFKQPVVWPGTLMGEGTPAEFEAFILAEFGCRAKYHGQFTTLPGDGGEGGREDLVFYVHSEDLGKFAVPRLAYGMRWIEDVLDNEARRISDHEQDATIYVPEFHALYSWTKD
jgi:hypothetical protein